MATAVKVGKEATHGTVASAFTSIPCNFSSTYRQSNKVLEEDRQGQDRHFQVMKGQAYNEWEVSDSGVYHDTVGFWLCSAIGAPTKTTVDTVFDNTFKFTDDPVSLSLNWQQPRRYTQAYQALYGVVDQFGVTFSAEGDLMYSVSGIAMAETEISTITHSWTTARPMPVWAGTVKLNNSAFAKLVSGSISISRNRKPFFVINNTQSPSAMNIGARTVEVELVIDFSAKTEYDYYKAATVLSTSNNGLEIAWEDAGVTIGTVTHPKFTVKLGSLVFESGEIDTGGDLPMLKVNGKALYNSSDASLAVINVLSSKDYTA